MVAESIYYDYGPVQTYDALLSLIAGSRGLGKTYGFIDLAINAYLKRKEQFFYLRRYKPDIQKSAGTFFKAHEEKYPFIDFRVQSVDGHVTAQIASAETRGIKGRQWDDIGYFGALSVQQQFKSTSFPRVTRMCYDECILEKGNTQYLPNEPRVLLNMINTVDRYREERGQKPVKTFALGNAVTMENPYFIDWGIDPSEPREFHKRFNGLVVVHLPDAAGFQTAVKTTRLAQLMELSDPEYAEYAIGNKFADAHGELIGEKTPDARYLYTLETSKKRYAIWVDWKTSITYVNEKPAAVERKFTIVRDRMSPDKVFLEYGHNILATLRNAYNNGNMRFAAKGQRNGFIEIFKR